MKCLPSLNKVIIIINIINIIIIIIRDSFFNIMLVPRQEESDGSIEAPSRRF